MDWSAVAETYDPLKAGSIDATDTVPHDHGIVRALNSTYKPNKDVTGEAKNTLFVGRLNFSTTEDTLENLFSEFGNIVQLRLIRDIVTGHSRGYAFVEFESARAAERACSRCNKTVVDDAEIFVDFECERTLPGWIPRRFGGGIGGKKESGQLRFGGVDRPFRKPVELMGKRHISQDNRSSFVGKNYDRTEQRDRRYGRDTHHQHSCRSPSRNSYRKSGKEEQRSYGRNSYERNSSRSRDKKYRRSRSKDRSQSRSESRKRE